MRKTPFEKGSLDDSVGIYVTNPLNEVILSGGFYPNPVENLTNYVYGFSI